MASSSNVSQQLWINNLVQTRIKSKCRHIARKMVKIICCGVFSVHDGRGVMCAGRLPTHAYAPRFQSRSATATPTTSPKKRQLPQIPHQVQLLTFEVLFRTERRRHILKFTLQYRTPSRWFVRRCQQISRNVSGSARITLAPHSPTAARHKVNTRKSAHRYFIMKN